jgi:hypothetical protein
MPTETRMNSSGPSPRSAHRAAAPEVKQGPRGTLRVLSEVSHGGTKPSSVVMPSANTDLAAMLARDGTLSVRPRSKPNADQQPETGMPTTSPQPPVDVEFARLTEVWPSLSASARAAIVAMAYEAAAEEK